MPLSIHTDSILNGWTDKTLEFQTILPVGSIRLKMPLLLDQQLVRLHQKPLEGKIYKSREEGKLGSLIKSKLLF